MLVISYSVIPPARSNSQGYTKMCVISQESYPHNSAGMVSCGVKISSSASPAPNDMFAYSELELFQSRCMVHLNQ